ncbi:hypothetical protein FRC08_002299 [Ceratobasidium sp. 394]|nr:hypothetical protein FRC08_002299 [Ceratobasidium sp. 394]
MEPDFDLLVLLELAEQTVDPDATQGTPNLVQHFNVNLRSLETCAAHPDAARPVIRHSLHSFPLMTWSFYFQIVGRYLAVLFLIGVENQPCQLRVWDWTTGNVVTYVDLVSGKSKTFAFLSDHLIVVPRYVTSNSPEERGVLGTLDVYTFDPPTDPPLHARHIASLQLPPLPQGVTSIPRLSCRSDPAPSPSTQSATWDRRRPRLFELAPTNRVLCLQAELVTIEASRQQFMQYEGTLYIPFTNMLDAVADLYNQSEPVIIPWDTWGYGTSWLDTSNLHTGNECFVYGQRVVTTGVNNEDEDEEDMPQKRTLVLLDFDPARASTRNNLFDPERETILTAPFEEDKLWNMFLGEGAECKANARFAIQTARIGQQLNSAFYVMIDDEHIVLVLVNTPFTIRIGFTNANWQQNRSGIESALLVYSF